MKYQDIETLLRGNVDPRLLKVIQHLHAENVGLKQEISGICRGLDKIVDTLNVVATIAGAHQQVFNGIAEGKSMSEVVAEMRSEHLSAIESEEIKQ